MFNSFRSLTVTGFLLVTVLGISSAHAVQLINISGPFNGAFFVRKCLNVARGSTANGTPIQGAACNSTIQVSPFFGQDVTFAQEWNWEGLTIEGIGLTTSRKCLDVLGGGTADRTLVQLFDCNGTGAQQWRYDNGRIINVRSGKCLDVDVFDSPVIVQARIFTCSDIRAVGQVWMIR